MKFKRQFLIIVLCLSLLSAMIPCYAEAAQNLLYPELLLDAEKETYAQKGDTVEMTYRLKSDGAKISVGTMQNVIEYDANELALVSGSITAADGVKTNDIALSNGKRGLYISFVSLKNETVWEADKAVCTAKFKVLSDSGVISLKNTKFKVTDKQGNSVAGTFDNTTRVIVSSECTVKFLMPDGAVYACIHVGYGEKIEKPADPAYEGNTFLGWYESPESGNEWNFEEDRVYENTELYARFALNENAEDTKTEPENKSGTNENEKNSDNEADQNEVISQSEKRIKSRIKPWTIIVMACVLISAALLLILFSARKKVSFDSNGGTPVKSVRVKKGERIPSFFIPEKDGTGFIGWYKDKELTERWIFESDTVDKPITLYAKWQ